MDTAISQLACDKTKAGKSGLLVVADNRDALRARVLAARSAVSSLDLMYYLWHDDDCGRKLMQEVVRAADRGVKVRILLDDINPRASDAAYLALNNQPNIQLRLFNPSGMRSRSILRGLELVLRVFALTRRMHTKAWIADGTVAIVGGRNIGDAYFDAADTNFRDLDLLMLGPAVAQTSRIFEAFWNSKASRPVDMLHTPRECRRAEIAEFIDYDDGPFDPFVSPDAAQTIAEFVAAANDVHWIDGVRVIADPPEKVLGRRRRNWLMKELLPIIEKSRASLQIVSPYFIPGRRGVAVLAQLVGRGVDVAVLTNSLAATDVAAVHGAYANYRVKLLRGGVKLFELQPFRGRSNISVFGSKGASLHTKAFTVDDRIGFVGSFNFDPRSISLNAEMGVLFEDETLAGKLRRQFELEKSPDTSYELSLRHRRLHWRSENHDYGHEPEAGYWRRAIAFLVRYLPIESQL